MKIFLTLLSLTSLMVSCVSKPPSARVLKLATPVKVEKPETKPIEEAVKTITTTTTKVGNAVTGATNSNEVSKTQIEALEGINKDFADQLTNLEEESQKAFTHLKERYDGVIIRLKEANDNISEKLSEAKDYVVELKKEVHYLSQKVEKQKVEIDKSFAEKEKLRELHADRIKSRESDEVYKSKYESLVKYKWFFWTLLGLAVLYALLRFKFRIL